MTRNLYYSSFATSFCVLLIEANIGKMISLEGTLRSIVLFFTSGVIWYAGHMVYALRIPEIIVDFKNVEDYLDKQKRVGNGENWSKEGVAKRSRWEDDEITRPAEKIVIVILLAIAALVYLWAFCAFLESSGPLLHRIYQPALAPPSHSVSHQ
jgi:hypothetical protein